MCKDLMRMTSFKMGALGCRDQRLLIGTTILYAVPRHIIILPPRWRRGDVNTKGLYTIFVYAILYLFLRLQFGSRRHQ